MLRGIEEAASMSGQYHSVDAGYSSSTFTTSATPTQSGPKVTRNRHPVSCAACRRSKLKCDRQKPCEACVRRGYRDQCFYETAKVVPRKKRRTVGSHNAQERLKNLEALVLQLAQPPAQTAATPTSSMGSAGQPGLRESHTPSDGHITVQGNASTYVGPTHWSAILENIQELKTVIVSEDVSEDGQPDQSHPFDPDTLILFSAPKPASMEKILEVLPPRPHLDRYLSTYFKASYLVLPILHQGRFQQEYEDFWRDPLQAPPLWTSILFSILTIASAVNLMNQSTNMEEEQARREEFLNASAQCLVYGNYGKPQVYLLEAMILFGQSKYVASLDPSREVALVCALIFRFAFEMGYHRDPSHFSHLTVFEGEMRRRVWAICLQIDLLQAFQSGLPPYIPVSSYDTHPFSNVPDSDFSESTAPLPPPRPRTSPTRLLQFSEKCRLITSFAPAFRAAISLVPVPLETITSLDASVRTAHALVPPCLQLRRIASSFADSSSVVMARIDIDLLYHRTLCTLHRKPMIVSHAYSRGVVRASAMAILSDLIELRAEMAPGRMLAGDQWLMSCYAMHDFLFAAMLLCLVVSGGRRRQGVGGSEEREELHMIREAYEATYALSGVSREARRVSNVLGRMLTSLESSSADAYAAQQSVKHDCDQDVAAALAFPANANAPLPEPHPHFTFEQDPFENLSSIPEDIDWACLDQYYMNMNEGMGMGMEGGMGAGANMFLYENAEGVPAGKMGGR